MNRIILFSAMAAILAPSASQAKVTLPQFFTDSMVVQRDATLTIPGIAKKNGTVKVTASWAPNSPIKTKADKNGKFKAEMPTPSVGGPFTITIDDGNSAVTLSDILAGDVWFCSGQSNMEMPVEGSWGKVMNYRHEIETANSPNVRLLKIQKQKAFTPQEDTKIDFGGWHTATPPNVGRFSSIGYFFGREVNSATDVPIGIIDCSWSGTPIESWSSAETLESIDAFGEELEAIKSPEALKALYAKNLEKWMLSPLPGKNTVQEAAEGLVWDTMPVPGAWENSVLPSFDGIVMMKKTFDVPASDAGQQAELHLACVDDEDITYVNGQLVGMGSIYNAPRSYSIPAGLLKSGENEVIVMVADRLGAGGICGEKDDMYIQTPSSKSSLAGDWEYSVISEYKALPKKPIAPDTQWYPTVLYNAMIHPASVLPVKGILWYQGCNNVGKHDLYSRNFKAMIQDWRKDFNNPDLPFYFVQLAAYLQPQRFQPDSEWAALRNAQADALELPHTGMAVAIDLGHPTDIHPKNKQEVAHRLAMAALNNEYGIPQEWKAPLVESVKIDGRNVIITFDKPINQFGGGHAYAVKSSDGKWAEGYGRIISERVLEVSSDLIDSPVEVRYNWADFPDGNLRGQTGLPVAPFTTSTTPK